MKRSAKPSKKTRTPEPRAIKKRRGAASARGFIRTVRGVEGKRGIHYRKDIFKTGTTTIYGPPPADENTDDKDLTCRLVKREDRKGKIRWTFYGPDLTLLRGEMAKGALQGRWNDTESMALVRAMESLRDHPQRMQEIDGAIVRAAMLDPDPERKAAWQAAQRAIHAGGLVLEGDLPRPYRIAQAVKKSAEAEHKPPTAMEVFRQFEEAEKAEGRQISKDPRNFYRDLAAAGWGWLLS